MRQNIAQKMKLATFDFETDPFKYGRVPDPFVCGFYDGAAYTSWWQKECPTKFVQHLETLTEPHVIYAHNGGKFDFWYLLPFMTAGSITIINSRIVKAKIGIHELRDSYAIMPFALAAYKKDAMNYEWLAKDKREKYRAEILEYLKNDCVYLYELCEGFRLEFGSNKLTIGSASLEQLKKFHTFSTVSKEFDSRFRDEFFFGGRNQVFEAGLIQGDFKLYDVNSMYPYVMKNFLHPIGREYYVGEKVTKETCFIKVEGKNYGAFPLRMEDGSLDFTTKFGTYCVSIHEWHAALETGTFEPTKIIRTYDFDERINFAEFVDHFYMLRKQAAKHGDEMHKLFYKFVLNSAYGKFSQNPDNYYDWQICTGMNRPCDWHDCNPAVCDDDCKKRWLPLIGHGFVLWTKPTPAERHRFNNVATGASITGAARAVLLRAIAAAKRPIYCDTDSLLCESLPLELDASELGAWKLEAEIDTVAMCGKKLYAMFEPVHQLTDITTGTNLEVREFKKAHKGVNLTPQDIIKIAAGETITAFNDAPAFGVPTARNRKDRNLNVRFTKRQIRRTV